MFWKRRYILTKYIHSIYICYSFGDFGHCVVCSSTIYGFWLTLWYLQTHLTQQWQPRRLQFTSTQLLRDETYTSSSALDCDVSDEIGTVTVDRHDLLVPMIYVGVLSLIGIPGNILVISVFALKHKYSIRRTIIIVLAIYDLLVSGITLPFREKWVCKIFRTLNYLFF